MVAWATYNAHLIFTLLYQQLFVCVKVLGCYPDKTVIDKSFPICARSALDQAAAPFYSAAALLAMQSAVLATAILSVCLSVRPSVTRWYPTQTNKDRIMRSSL